MRTPGSALLQAHAQLAAGERRVALEQPQRELQRLLHVGPLALALARGVEQEPHDPLAALDLGPDQVAELERLAPGVATALGGDRGERLGAAGDAGERVRDLVRHAGHELAEVGRAVLGDQAHLELSPLRDVLEPRDHVGRLAAALHRQAPHVVDAVRPLDDLLVRPAAAEHAAQHRLGGGEAFLAQHRAQRLADGARARPSERALLAEAIPGDHLQLPIDDVEADRQRVEHGPERIDGGLPGGACRHAESIAGL